MAKRLTRTDLVEDGPISAGNYYHYIKKAKDGGYITEAKDDWGEETRGKPRKAYLISELRQFFEEDETIKQPNREAVLEKLDELENGAG